MSKLYEKLQMAGLATMLPFLAATAFANDLPEEFMSCSAERNDQRRLVCYDREMARLQPVVAEQTAVAPASGANAEDPASTVADVELQHQEDSIATTVAAAASVPQLTASESAAVSSASTSSNGQGASDMTSVPDVDPQPETVSPSPQDAGETSAIVTKIARQPRGEHVVYLDNGQVWAEQSRSSYFPVEPGDTISIKKRKFAGFRLLTETGKGFNVERLR